MNDVRENVCDVQARGDDDGHAGAYARGSDDDAHVHLSPSNACHVHHLCASSYEPSLLWVPFRHPKCAI